MQWHSRAMMIMATALFSPVIALSVYRGTFASFKDAFQYFLYLGDGKSSVEVSQVALRTGVSAVSRLHELIQTYAAQRGLILRFDKVQTTIPGRQFFRFHLVGQAFHISVDNDHEQDVFVATFIDNEKEDWEAHRDEFVRFFANAFGKGNVYVIE